MMYMIEDGLLDTRVSTLLKLAQALKCSARNVDAGYESAAYD